MLRIPGTSRASARWWCRIPSRRAERSPLPYDDGTRGTGRHVVHRGNNVRRILRALARADLHDLVLGVVLDRVALVADLLAVAEDLARVVDREAAVACLLDDLAGTGWQSG